MLWLRIMYGSFFSEIRHDEKEHYFPACNPGASYRSRSPDLLEDKPLPGLSTPPQPICSNLQSSETARLLNKVENNFQYILMKPC